MTADPAPLATIGVLERNRAVGQRVSRIMRAASPNSPIILETTPDLLRASLSPDTRLIACEEADIDGVLTWAPQRFPKAKIICWTTAPAERLIRLAEECPALVSVIAWPAFASMPRSWEVLLAAQRILGEPSVPPLAGLLHYGANVTVIELATTDDRDRLVNDVTLQAQELGGVRMGQRVGEIAHEMIMNAMYDAPVNQYGQALYSHDRKQELILGEGERPQFSFASDGSFIALRIRDGFGRLEQHHLTEGILRGFSGQQQADAHRVLSTGNGGAGLGLFRMYVASNVLTVDVDPGRETVLTALIDLDLSVREARGIPASIHFPIAIG